MLALSLAIQPFGDDVGVKAYYSALVAEFLTQNENDILAVLTMEHHHTLEESQREAWLRQIEILRQSLVDRHAGKIYLEFFIPRMGKRVDALLLTDGIAFVIEFKVGAKTYDKYALDQAEDYALDLKNFHEGSHNVPIIPVLVATAALAAGNSEPIFSADQVACPLKVNANGLGELLEEITTKSNYTPIQIERWESTGYRPTPTVIEAARVLYQGHSVEDISRSDAGALNLQETAASVDEIVSRARQQNFKAICFVTGVPGSGKTLAGLNIATQRSLEYHDEHAVFLSGNDPLVNVLRTALKRDKAKRKGEKNAREVEQFIQNIRHFRDEGLKSQDPTSEKVVVFDESQRAWTRDQLAKFMEQKRGRANFQHSEPEFLIGVMNRHKDWCVIVCLIGGGQEINTGEAGMSEWIEALSNHFPDWQCFVSPQIALPEYGLQKTVESFLASPRTHSDRRLHLAVSMRSFRAKKLSDFVAHVLDGDLDAAKSAYQSIQTNYPIYLTRNLADARKWLKARARGTERYGIVASSGAQRLRPEGIYIKAKVDPACWFLNSSEDVRSSSHLEEVASEFDVQGLELDWAAVGWDGDFYYSNAHWNTRSFKGTKWQSVKDANRKLYLKNAYRVILTRARQGMVIFVPWGNAADDTRLPAFYDGTYQFLRACGIPDLNSDAT